MRYPQRPLRPSAARKAWLLALLASSPALAQQTATTTLPTVTVTGEQTERADGPVPGIVATRSATGTKTDTSIMETPQSISVVGAQEIRTIGAQNVTDALGYVAGVARFEGQDTTTDALMIRGFQSIAAFGNMYRDGMKYQINPYNGQQEPYGMERLEVLKGASSVLYGVSAPGGIVNAVSKRPSTIPMRELNLEYGSFDRKQISGDFTGAIDKDENWSYRLVFLERNADSNIDYIRNDRTFIAPSLKWQPSAATSLTFLAEYQRDRTNYIYGLPIQGTIAPNINGRISRDLYVGEKSDKTDYNEVDRYTVGYLFEHAFNDRVKVRNALRYMQADVDRGFTSMWGISADQRSPAGRLASNVDEMSRAVTSDTSLEINWDTGRIAHTTLVGLDYSYQNYTNTQSDRNVGTLDFFNPVYHQPVSDAFNFRDRLVRSNRVGIYAQDQMKIADKWILLLGGRQDWSRDTNRAFFATKETKENTSAFSGRAGVVYLADNGLAPFVSFSQSFEPTVGEDRSGNRFKPTEGEQYEVGMRYQPPGTDMLFSATTYQLTRTNVTVTDPVDINYSVQQGKVRSRGFEFEARAKLGRNTNLIAAYAYTDARTIKSSPMTPQNEGKRTGAVPYNQLSLWLDHDFASLGVPGLKAGAGVRYVGSTKGLYVEGEVPSFTLIDAMVSYTTGPWRFAINATNLTDKYYVASCTYGCFYGEPRKVIGTVSYRW